MGVVWLFGGLVLVLCGLFGGLVLVLCGWLGEWFGVGDWVWFGWMVGCGLDGWFGVIWWVSAGFVV